MVRFTPQYERVVFDVAFSVAFDWTKHAKTLGKIEFSRFDDRNYTF